MAKRKPPNRIEYDYDEFSRFSDEFNKTVEEPILENDPNKIPIPDYLYEGLENLAEIYRTPTRLLGKGIEQITGDNPIAGAINFGQGLLHAVFTLSGIPQAFALGDIALRGVGADQAADNLNAIINTPVELYKIGEKAIDKGLEGLGYIKDLDERVVMAAAASLGIYFPPDKQDELKEAISETGQLGATLLGFKALHSGIKGVKGKLGIPEKISEITKFEETELRVEEPKQLEQTLTKRGERVFEADTKGNIKQVLTEKQKLGLGKLKTEKTVLGDRQIKLTEEIKTLRKDNKGERKALPKAKDKKVVGKRIKANNELIKEKRNELLKIDPRLTKITKQIDQFEEALKFEGQKLLPKEAGKSGISKTENIPSDINFAVAKTPKGQIKGSPVLIYNPKSKKFKMAERQPEGLTEEKVLPVKTNDYTAVQTDKGVRFKDPKSGKIISKDKAVEESTKQAEKPQTYTIEQAKEDARQIANKALEKHKDAPEKARHEVANTITEISQKALTAKMSKGELDQIAEIATKVTDRVDRIAKAKIAEKAEVPKVEKPKLIEKEGITNDTRVGDQIKEELITERNGRKFIIQKSPRGNIVGQVIEEPNGQRMTKGLNNDGTFFYEGEGKTLQSAFDAFDKIFPKEKKGAVKSIEPPKTEAKGKRFISEENHKKDIDIIKDDLSKQPSKFLPFSSPKVQMAYTRAGAYHLENVVRSGVKKAQQFKEWSKPMIIDFGQKIKPYLLKIWVGIKREFGKKLIEYAEKNPFIKPLGVVEGGFSEALKGSKISDIEMNKHVESFKKRNKFIKKTKDSATREKESVKKSLSKSFKPKDTRLSEIHPRLYSEIKKNAFNEGVRQVNDFGKISKITSPASKFPVEIQGQIDALLKNNERHIVRRFFKEQGLEKEFDNVVSVIDKLSSDLGMEKTIKGWWPRQVKDYKGLVNNLYEKLATKLNPDEVKNVRNVLQKLKADKEKRIGNKLTIEQEADLYNNALRGYNPGIKLSKIANERQRVIEVLDSELSQYYHNWDTAVTAYVGQAIEKISARKFFGNKKLDPSLSEKSIGRMIAEKGLGELTSEQIRDMKNILESGFEPRGTEPWVSTVKDLGYLTRLFNFLGAMTQLGDYAMPLYRAPFRAVGSTIKAIGGQIPGIRKALKSDIPLRKIGVDVERFAHEIADPRSRNKILRKASIHSAFKGIDISAKEAFINSLYKKYRALAKRGKLKKGHPDYWRFEKRFGEQADAVIKEFATKKPDDLTGRMAFQLWDELDATQPYSKWATPETYSRGGAAAKLAYQFKTFAIRRLDFILNESVRRMRDPKLSRKDRLRAARNLIHLLGVITLVEGSVDVAKKFLKGDEIILSDIAVDNLLRLILLSRYDMTNVRRDGFVSAIVSKTTAITGVFDDVGQDLLGVFGIGEFKGKSIRNIPVVGETIYSWMRNSIKKSNRSKRN